MSTGKMESATDWRTIGERTRRQLEELDALLERMLALPPLDTPVEPTTTAAVSPAPQQSVVGDPSATALSAPLSTGRAVAGVESLPTPPSVRSHDFGPESRTVTPEKTNAPHLSETQPSQLPPRQSPQSHTRSPTVERAVPSAGAAGATPEPARANATDSRLSAAPSIPGRDGGTEAATSVSARPNLAGSTTQKTPTESCVPVASSSPATGSVSSSKPTAPEKGPAWLLREDGTAAATGPDQHPASPVHQTTSDAPTPTPSTPLRYAWLHAAGRYLHQFWLWCDQSPSVLTWLGWIGILLLLGSVAIWLGVWLSWYW
ncbi:MAG: hypothetical protein RMJ19_01695 [Gemmatales bacterium]|nr:hypothetical protein [Gemmatales bacterium]MDW8174359.1 hypothetical protein [Gemmatales bacterium]